jgi:hypothetical protein
MAVIPVAGSYYEIVDGESPSRIVMDKNTATAYMTFLIRSTDLYQFTKDVLGYSILKNNSYISRPSIGLSHPLYPWMYAYKIADIKGQSIDGKISTTTLQNQTGWSDIKTEKPDRVGFYSYLKVTVNFISREYNLYTDEQVAKFSQPNQPYTVPIKNPNSGFWSERQETYTDRFEYSRFTNYKIEPIVEMLTYGGGNYYLKMGTGRPAAAPPELPISMENGGANFIKLIKSKIAIKTFQVPFQYCINNSLWQYCYSKINLNPILGFNKGVLLLQDIEVNKYESVYPFENIDLTFKSSVYDYFTQFYANQYADVQFNCIAVEYPTGTRPTVNPTTYFNLSCKDINSFHNRLLGPASRYWYYIESAKALQVLAGAWAPDARGSPIYWSTPLELMWNYVEGP